MKKKQSLNRLKTEEAIAGYMFIFPSLLALAVFVVYPILNSLVMSFTNWDMVSIPRYIGFDNFIKMMSDNAFWQSLKNTAIFTLLNVPLGIVLGLMFAVLLDQRFRGKTLYRAIIFLPTILSMVAISMVWRWLLNKDFGIVNYLTSELGIDKIGWLTNDKYAIYTVSFIAIWKTLGFNMVILLAGMQGVPQTLYEAATIDGASKSRQFFKITLPLISPSLFFVGVMSVINSFQAFDIVYMTTVDRVTGITRVPVLYYYLWKKAFYEFEMGYASAVSWVVFIILIGMTILQVRVLGKKINYDLG